MNTKAASQQTQELPTYRNTMNNIFKGLLAGYGAMKLGGGCFGTIIVFIAIWLLIGMFS